MTVVGFSLSLAYRLAGLRSSAVFLIGIYNEKNNTIRLATSHVEKKVSEKELAARLGVKPPYVAALLSGTKNVTVNQLERIAEVLGMTLHIEFLDPG